MIQMVRSWLRKHWHIAINRPTNGHGSLIEIDEQIRALRGISGRVHAASEQIVSDTERAQGIIANDNSTASH